MLLCSESIDPDNPSIPDALNSSCKTTNKGGTDPVPQKKKGEPITKRLENRDQLVTDAIPRIAP